MVHDNRAVPFNHILSLSIEERGREISRLMFGSPIDYTNLLEKYISTENLCTKK
jgi:hypothetical protein